MLPSQTVALQLQHSFVSLVATDMLITGVTQNHLQRRVFASRWPPPPSSSRRHLKSLSPTSRTRRITAASSSAAPEVVPNIGDLFKALNSYNAEMRAGINELKMDFNELKTGFNELNTGVKNLNLGKSEVAVDSPILPFMAAINAGSVTRTPLGNGDRSPTLLAFVDPSVLWPSLDSPQLLERYFYQPFVESILGGLTFQDKSKQMRAVVLGSPGIGTSSPSPLFAVVHVDRRRRGADSTRSLERGGVVVCSFPFPS